MGSPSLRSPSLHEVPSGFARALWKRARATKHARMRGVSKVRVQKPARPLGDPKDALGVQQINELAIERSAARVPDIAS
jgi:hypothetical protein